MQSQRRRSQQQRFIVSQLLNTWVVRDTDLLKQKKRSIVYEAATKEEAESHCRARNEPEKVRIE